MACSPCWSTFRIRKRSVQIGWVSSKQRKEFPGLDGSDWLVHAQVQAELAKEEVQDKQVSGLQGSGIPITVSQAAFKPHIIWISLTFYVSETDPIKYFTFSMIISILGIRGILLNRRNIPIMSMPIESMLLAVNSNFLVFSVSLDDMMGQLFALLVLTVAAAESAIGSAIFVNTFRVRGTIAVESINCIQG